MLASAFTRLDFCSCTPTSLSTAKIKAAKNDGLIQDRF